MKNWLRRDILSKFEREIVTNVDKHGCHISGVFDPDGNDPSFAYSIGFTKTLELVNRPNAPEVIMFGLPSEVYGPAINELLAMCASQVELTEGMRLEKFFGEYDCVVRMVSEDCVVDTYLASAIWYHQTQMGRQLKNVAMLVWPDAESRFPWEDDCEEWVRIAQPAIYEQSIN